MVAILLPAGQFAGEFYAEAGAESPEYYEVRLGREVYRLDPGTYAVWAFTHGDPQALVAGEELNRLSVNAMARDSGLGDISQQLGQLQELGLVLQVLPVGAQLQRFAENHRLRSLSVGLGNASDNLEMMRIGLPEQTRVSVPALAYSVWMYSDAYDSLWETCTGLAAQFVTESGESLSPSEVLKSFFETLPTLIAVSCVYIDRR